MLCKRVLLYSIDKLVDHRAMGFKEQVALRARRVAPLRFVHNHYHYALWRMVTQARLARGKLKSKDKNKG